MNTSIAFASLTLALVASSCGGFTGIGQGEGGADGEPGGTTSQGGSKPGGGAPSSGGGVTFGGTPAIAGSGAAANAPSTGGAAGGGAANPCAGKACGDSCSEKCPEGHSCPTADMYCNEQGLCQLTEPACVQASCEDDGDCPEVELCSLCAEGNCAELKCLKGACQFTCDPGGAGGAGGANGGTCAAEAASCAGGETCCAGLTCCAGVPVPSGNEYCGRECPDSDENIKRDFASVDPDQILDKLSRLPVGTWAYRTEGSAVRHIGPMAQDFKAAFQVGPSDRAISKVDADGVAFAAIQALNARLKALEERNQELRSDLDALRRQCEP